MPAMLSFSLGGLNPSRPSTRLGTTMNAVEAIAAPRMNFLLEIVGDEMSEDRRLEELVFM
jgi:hypothetical protein